MNSCARQAWSKSVNHHCQVQSAFREEDNRILGTWRLLASQGFIFLKVLEGHNTDSAIHIAPKFVSGHCFSNCLATEMLSPDIAKYF